MILTHLPLTGFSPQLRNALDVRVIDGPQELDMAHWMGRTALELIGQGGFSHSFDPLVENKRDLLAISLKLFLYDISTARARQGC